MKFLLEKTLSYTVGTSKTVQENTRNGSDRGSLIIQRNKGRIKKYMERDKVIQW